MKVRVLSNNAVMAQTRCYMLYRWVGILMSVDISREWKQNDNHSHSRKFPVSVHDTTFPRYLTFLPYDRWHILKPALYLLRRSNCNFSYTRLFRVGAINKISIKIQLFNSAWSDSQKKHSQNVVAKIKRYSLGNLKPYRYS